MKTKKRSKNKSRGNIRDKCRIFRIERNTFLTIITVFSVIHLIYASTFVDNNSGDFDSGTYNWTFYNSSGFVQLNSSRLNGTYTSQIFNAGSLSRWNNISWTQGGYYQQELPNSQATETGLGGLNMTGNILLMHLNEASGTIYDSSGMGNNGTVTAALSNTTNCRFGNCYTFDGNGDYIDININIPATVTISAWGKSSTTNLVDMLWCIGNTGTGGPDLFFYTNNIYLNTWDGGGNLLCAQPNVSQWHLYTTVIDSTANNAQLYIDGKLCGTGAYRNPTKTTFAISSSNGYDWQGEIDEFAIWNRSLSTSEILNIYKRGAERLNLSVQSCNDASCSGESFTNLGNNLTSPQNLSVDNNTYFQYKYEFETDNSSYTPELYNVTINYDLLDVAPPSITLNNPVNNSNFSIQTINFNFTATEDYPQNMECSIYLNDVLNQTNSSTQNNTSTNFEISGISEGSHTWKISCEDGARNSNSSQTRTFYIDLSSPTISNIIYSPNSTDYLDPSINITINATVTDSRVSVSTVILQYHNGTTWANKTMSNNSATNYNTTITLISTEANYTFNIWANDSFGNAGTSSNTTFNSTWDCTWSVSPSSLEEVIGFFEDKAIGNITITNTGDSQYSNNNCSISFTIGYTGFSSEYTNLLADSSNWATGNRAFQYTSPIIVNSSTNSTFGVNASFPSTTSPFTETPTITLTSDINDSVSGNKTTTVSSTLLISPPNPLLYQDIATYPSTYVYLTPGNYSLDAYVRNLGYDASNSINTTAHNVSFNWTLPSAISSRASGNITGFYETLNTSEKQYSNLTLSLTSSNLASMSKGTLNLTIYSKGYQNDSSNSTLRLITNSGNQTLLNETISIEFLCYDEEDGICVSACGVGVDPDCSLPSDSGETTTGGGGGGGGGGATTTESITTSADFQLIRGEENEVKIVFENRDQNESLKDLTFSVTGKISKYIDITPKQVSYLGPEKKITTTLTITSPTYIELGKQELTITMKGKKGVKDYTDSKKITLEIHELSVERAEEMLNESEELIKKLEEINLSSNYLNNLLNESYKSMEIFNLELVRDNYNLIKKQVNYALDSIKTIKELENLISSAEKKAIDVSQSARLLKLAKLSIERLEFEQAYNRVKDAQLTYALEVKGEFGKLSYYLKEYPGEISLATLFLFVFSFGSYKLNKLKKIKSRIKELKNEEKILNELIRVLQKECFKDKKMGMEEYENAMKEYNKKLSQTIEELIELETKRVYILRFTSKNKLLTIEKKRIIELIKEIQEDYMKKKKLETRTFELKMESFNKKLSEIEEKLATLEAKKASKGLGISLRIPKE